MPDVFDAIFHHNDSLNAVAPRKAGVFIRIDASHFKYIRVNHAAAQKLMIMFVSCSDDREWTRGATSVSSLACI